MKLLKGARGTSIVEVLVVMVVLLVGILTIVRLFPPGFRSVRHAESTTFASRLAQYELERWKNNPENLPDGILPIDINGTILDNLSPIPPIDNTNVSSFRRIIGETARIPFGGWSTEPTSGSYYMLAFSPIDTSPGHPLAVRGGELSRRIFDSSDTMGSPPWSVLRSYQYGVDYGQSGDMPEFCFPHSDQERIYYLSCSWWELSGTEPVLRSATSLKVYVFPSSEWIPLNQIFVDSGMTVPPNFIGIDPYSDTVSRGFNDVTLMPGFSPDPYEFKLIDPVLGIIAFNPLGYAQTEFGRRLQAKIDYDILDLQIIHEDKRVSNSASAPYRVRLTLNRIKQIGVTLEVDGNPYKGIYPPPKPDDEQVDILAVDLETTLPIAIDRSWVNYRDGIVDLPNEITVGFSGSTFTISPMGRNIRFFYKAEGDWSLQFQKAYSLYEREQDEVPLTYRTYTIDANPSHLNRLWFAACNTCCTIAVDYEYNDNGNMRKVVGESHKTSDMLVGGRTYLDLNNTPTRIFSVNGVSAKARVAWRDSERWRHVDLDTILTRRQSD